MELKVEKYFLLSETVAVDMVVCLCWEGLIPGSYMGYICNMLSLSSIQGNSLKKKIYVPELFPLIQTHSHEGLRVKKKTEKKYPLESVISERQLHQGDTHSRTIQRTPDASIQSKCNGKYRSVTL